MPSMVIQQRICWLVSKGNTVMPIIRRQKKPQAGSGWQSLRVSLRGQGEGWGLGEKNSRLN